MNILKKFLKNQDNPKIALLQGTHTDISGFCNYSNMAVEAIDYFALMEENIFERLGKSGWDAIILNQVIERLQRPVMSVLQISRHLKVEGLLIIFALNISRIGKKSPGLRKKDLNTVLPNDLLIQELGYTGGIKRLARLPLVNRLTCTHVYLAARKMTI
jgi:hypothetical protein